MSQTSWSDALVRHQIFLQRYAGGVNNRAQNEVDRILDLMLDGILSGTLNQFQYAYVYGLFEQVAELGYNESIELLEFESDWLARALDSTNNIQINPIAIDQLKAIYNDRPAELVQGKTVISRTPQQLANQYSRAQASNVLKIIRDGIIEGDTKREIQKKLTDLVKTRTKNQTEAFIRTMLSQSANTAKEETYKIADIKREEYVAVLDRRTTVTCADFDGKIFAIGNGPIPPLHFGCRSMRVALIGNSKSANVGEYGKWLKRQPVNVQNEVLGVERAKLFRKGVLQIGQFTNDQGIEYTLIELEQLYNIEID